MMRIHHIARALAMGWAGLWVLFGLSSGLSEGMSLTGVLLHTAVPGMIFLASAVIAWRWEMIGGIVLMLEGLLMLIFYPAIAIGRISLWGIVLVVLTMALPPLIAGFLFHLNQRNLRASGNLV